MEPHSPPPFPPPLVHLHQALRSVERALEEQDAERARALAELRELGGVNVIVDEHDLVALEECCATPTPSAEPSRPGASNAVRC